MNNKHSVRTFVYALFVAAGCNASNAPPSEPTPTSAKVTQAVAAGPAATKVTKIVFVGKEHACDCTRKRVDDSWAALQRALGTPAKVPVERVQMDTEGSRVAPYQKQKPIMALPGLYFVDAKDVVVELLQGEVTADQISRVLDGTAPRLSD